MSKIRVLATGSFLLAFAFLAMGVRAQDGPPVLHVVTVDTHGKTAAYVKAIAPLIKRTKELSPGSEVTVYEALYSGEDAGKVYVALAFPNMAALASFQTRSEADEEFAKHLAALEATGRTILGRSVLVNRTP